jgi:fructose-1,6-bisphosphatase/inositol monophosphatase family enzyme
VTEFGDSLTKGVSAIMREAARRAILPRFRKLADHEIYEKAADDFVTIADREAEEILSSGLAQLLPEASIVGEEASHADPEVLERLANLCWIIDPLDGTYNFTNGVSPFGVIVALADAGEALGGWIYDPLSERFCHARKGAGAFIDGQRIVARATGEQPPIAAISLLFLDQTERAAISSHIAPHYTVVDIPRCAAEQYPRLALGQNDLSIFQRTLPWDHAAGVLWLNEAGGKAARPDGSPYRVDEYARPGLIGAATPELWEALARRLNALPHD